MEMNFNMGMESNIDINTGNSRNNKGTGAVVTVEDRLKLCASNGEREEIMWHAWKHNKRWLLKLMEWIMPSFPMYSQHGESHMSSVMHNIEMILGRDQISRLNASDCFLLLHTVYIHDIGMCITYADREALMKNKEFIEFLEEKMNSSNDVIQKYATLLLTFCRICRI